jgi:hypothetical protein
MGIFISITAFAYEREMGILALFEDELRCFEKGGDALLRDDPTHLDNQGAILWHPILFPKCQSRGLVTAHSRYVHGVVNHRGPFWRQKIGCREDFVAIIAYADHAAQRPIDNPSEITLPDPCPARHVASRPRAMIRKEDFFNREATCHPRIRSEKTKIMEVQYLGPVSTQKASHSNHGGTRKAVHRLQNFDSHVWKIKELSDGFSRLGGKTEGTFPTVTPECQGNLAGEAFLTADAVRTNPLNG